ncbi:MAG: DJ-1/PfpI family protein [bacterium]
MTKNNGSKVLLLLPAARFDDAVYQKTKAILERNGHAVTVAAPKKTPIFGLNRGQVIPNITLEEIKISDYDALVLASGIGYRDYWEFEPVQEFIREAHRLGLLIAAIANTPMLLARSGILKGKKATGLFYESKDIKDNGGEYIAASVHQDGNILTAKEAAMADQYGLALAKALKPPPAA